MMIINNFKINKTSFFIIVLLFNILYGISLKGQQDELDKLKSLIEKGNLQKAQAYCDKVTAPMAEKTSSKFYALMANAYYKDKDFLKSAEVVQKSGDFKLAIKLAKEFDNPSVASYDLDLAILLYKYGKEYDKAGELLFGQKRYKESAATCVSAGLKMKYGDSLFNQGKMAESLYFYTRSKTKGKKFDNQKVLDLVYSKSAYKTAYEIQDYNESEFQMAIQGTVIDKMVETGENQSFIYNFLDSIKISKNKQQEVMIEAFINNKKFDKAMNYCMEQKGSDHQVCLRFYADKTAETHPEISARVNTKLNNPLLAQDLLTNYLIDEAKGKNAEWENEPIDKKLIQAYYNKTKVPVEDCGQNYCDFIKFASNKCIIKKDELQKSKSNKAEEFSKTVSFLQAVLKNFCK